MDAAVAAMKGRIGHVDETIAHQERTRVIAASFVDLLQVEEHAHRHHAHGDGLELAMRQTRVAEHALGELLEIGAPEQLPLVEWIEIRAALATGTNQEMAGEADPFHGESGPPPDR